MDQRNFGNRAGDSRDEFASFVEDFEREASDILPSPSEIVALARRDAALDTDNLRQLAASHSHLLSKARALEFNAVILNSPHGTAKYRIALLEPLSADAKYRLSRLLGIYSTSETAIKFQIVDPMLFEILYSEAYEPRNRARTEQRQQQQQTREKRVWGGDGGGKGAAAETKAADEAATIEELAGHRLDISDLISYYKLKAQLDAGIITENSLDTLRFVIFLLQDFILSGASDLHLHSRRGGGRIRYRFQGKAYVRFDGIPAQRFQQIAYCLCSLGGKDPSKMKQLGVATVIKLKILIDGAVKPVEFRLQSLSTLHNPSIILRGQAKPLRDIKQIGFIDEQLGDIMSAISNDRGIVVVTGPTGSGKTNTLNCILAILEEDDEKVIIEIGAPIEIESPSRLQITMPETPSEAQNEIIRQKFFMDAMRSDPDVICYTEIRSADEAKTAFRAAVTGHLVLTTLHAADVEETFGRLFEMGIDRSIISKGILAFVAQTLIRKLCEECKIEDAEATQMTGSAAVVYRANEIGCGECDDGYKGRTVVAEVLRFNGELQKMITDGLKASELVKACVARGWMQPMKRVALGKLSSGITSEDEVINLLELKTSVNADAAMPVIEDYESGDLPIQDAEYIDME